MARLWLFPNKAFSDRHQEKLRSLSTDFVETFDVCDVVLLGLCDGGSRAMDNWGAYSHVVEMARSQNKPVLLWAPGESKTAVAQISALWGIVGTSEDSVSSESLGTLRPTEPPPPDHTTQQEATKPKHDTLKIVVALLAILVVFIGTIAYTSGSKVDKLVETQEDNSAMVTEFLTDFQLRASSFQFSFKDDPTPNIAPPTFRKYSSSVPISEECPKTLAELQKQLINSKEQEANRTKEVAYLYTVVSNCQTEQNRLYGELQNITHVLGTCQNNLKVSEEEKLYRESEWLQIFGNQTAIINQLLADKERVQKEIKDWQDYVKEVENRLSTIKRRFE